MKACFQACKLKKNHHETAYRNNEDKPLAFFKRLRDGFEERIIGLNVPSKRIVGFLQESKFNFKNW